MRKLFICLIFFFSMCACSSDEPDVAKLFQKYASKTVADDSLNPQASYMVVIGDIQEYITPVEFGKDCYPYYLKTMAWIRSQQLSFGNIAAVLITGDMTWHNLPLQWRRYRAGASFVEDELPLLLCTGNHDYDIEKSPDGRPLIPDRNSCLINGYFPGSAAAGVICETLEPGRYENYVAALQVGDRMIHLLSLEFAPRREIVDRAREIVESHPDRTFILLTHEIISHDRLADSDSFGRLQFEGTGSTYTTPRELWETLVYPNDNILCTICGHNQYFSHLTLKNAAGRDVSNVMFNLQDVENCGDGRVMLWEFLPGATHIGVRVYNTVSRRTLSAYPQPFTIPLPL